MMWKLHASALAGCTLLGLAVNCTAQDKGGLLPPSKLLPSFPSDSMPPVVVPNTNPNTIVSKSQTLTQAPVVHFSPKHGQAPVKTLNHIDLRIPAARVEVAWLSDPMTYGYRLSAKSEGSKIELLGFLPSEALKHKAMQIARIALGTVTFEDKITVYPQMALAPAFDLSDKSVITAHERLKAMSTLAIEDLSLVQDDQGVLIVSGRVDHFDDRLKIIDAMKMLPGCKAIKYDLNMGPPRVISSHVETVAAPPVKLSSPVAAKAQDDGKLNILDYNRGSAPTVGSKTIINSLPYMPPAQDATRTDVPKLPMPGDAIVAPALTPATAIVPSAFFDPVPSEEIKIAPKSLDKVISESIKPTQFEEGKKFPN